MGPRRNLAYKNNIIRETHLHPEAKMPAQVKIQQPSHIECNDTGVQETVKGVWVKNLLENKMNN